jgi:hypothetical protein
MGSAYGIARAIEQLIAAGHPADRVWKYTPRMMAGYAQLAHRRRLGELAELLLIGHAGAQGTPKEVSALQRKLQEEGR